MLVYKGLWQFKLKTKKHFISSSPSPTDPPPPPLNETFFQNVDIVLVWFFLKMEVWLTNYRSNNQMKRNINFQIISNNNFLLKTQVPCFRILIYIGFSSSVDLCSLDLTSWPSSPFKTVLTGCFVQTANTKTGSYEMQYYK